MSLCACSPLLSLRAALAFASRLLRYVSTFRLLPFHPSPRNFEPSERPQRLPSRHGPQAAIVMNVDLIHPHDAVLLSWENKLAHTDQHRCSGFKFHGANTASSEISLLFDSMIVAVA